MSLCVTNAIVGSCLQSFEERTDENIRVDRLGDPDQRASLSRSTDGS